MRLRSGRFTTEVVLAEPEVVLAEPTAEPEAVAKPVPNIIDFVALLKECENKRTNDFIGNIVYTGKWCNIILDYLDILDSYDPKGKLKWAAQSRINRWRNDHQKAIRAFTLAQFKGDTENALAEIQKTNTAIEDLARKIKASKKM